MRFGFLHCQTSQTMNFSPKQLKYTSSCILCEETSDTFHERPSACPQGLPHDSPSAGSSSWHKSNTSWHLTRPYLHSDHNTIKKLASYLLLLIKKIYNPHEKEKNPQRLVEPKQWLGCSAHCRLMVATQTLFLSLLIVPQKYHKNVERVFHFLATWKSESQKPQSQFPLKNPLKNRTFPQPPLGCLFCHTGPHRPKYLENEPQKSVVDEHKNLESQMFLKSICKSIFILHQSLMCFLRDINYP